MLYIVCWMGFLIVNNNYSVYKILRIIEEAIGRFGYFLAFSYSHFLRN